MHVVVVRHRREAVLALGAQQDLVGDRAAERADALAAQIGERAEPRRVGVADAEHFAELVVRKRDRHRRAARRRVFDAAQADVGVAAGDALIDRAKRDVDELRRPAESGGEQLGDLDVEADEPIGVRGIGFDERRAAFGIAGPAQHARLRCAPTTALDAGQAIAEANAHRRIARTIARLNTGVDSSGRLRWRLWRFSGPGCSAAGWWKGCCAAATR